MAIKRKHGAKTGSQAPRKRTKNNSSKSAGKHTESDPPLLFVENPDGVERKRQAELYELLGSDDPDERLKAAERIILSLFHGDGVSEAVLHHHLDHRLFRGLASGRGASRLGFSIVLQELLRELFGENALSASKYKNLTFNAVLGMMIKRTQSTGSVSGKEERDYLLGRLFGIMSFIVAKVLFSDTSRWTQVLSLLLDLAHNTVWLRSACGWAIIESIPQMTKEQAIVTLGRIHDAHLSQTPEGLSIWLAALSRFPDLKVQPWREPLSTKNFGDIAAVLRESFQHFEDEVDLRPKNKQSNWTARLHYVWDLILAHFVRQGQAGAEQFNPFWIHVVDASLFSKAATDGQKFKGFMAFQRMLEGLVGLPLHLEALFSPNILRCLMNQAAKEERYLHRAATKALKAIESTTSAHPSTITPILKGLLGQSGDYKFDQRTKTKTIERILQNVTEETGEKAIKAIRKPLDTLGQQETAHATSLLRVYVDYLSTTLSASAASTSEKMQHNVFSAALQELSQLAYSQPKHIPIDALTEGVRKLCQTRLESSLAKVSRRTGDYGTICLAVSSIDPDSVAMPEEVRTAVQEALSRMQKLLKRKAANDNEKSLFQNLAILHAVSVIQLYNGDPEAMDVLDYLAENTDRLKKGNSTGSEIGKSEVGPSDVLVEILLSLVARPSSLMRQISQQVFDAFTPQVSAKGLELLTGPLSPGENTKGQKELFSTGDDETEVDEDEDNSDIEIDSDVEFIDINDANEESGKDEDEDEDEEDDENEGEFDKPEDLENALEKILKSHRLDKDVDAESSESEGDMSDSEMFAIDAQLAATIKPRIQDRTNDSKKQKKEAKQLVVNFKHRALDLLDIYVHNESHNPLSFALLLPLLNLMRTTSTKPLAARARDIIRNYQKGLKKARSNSQEFQIRESDDLLGLLHEIHDAAGQDDAHEYAKAASAASLIVASALCATDKSNMRDVDAVYSKTRLDWAMGEIKLQKSFLDDWNNWCQNAHNTASLTRP